MFRKRKVLAQINNLVDFEPFAASPPSHDESFFYIRYPKAENLFGKAKATQDIGNLISQDMQGSVPSITATVRDKDWTKHTKPCQDVLHGIAPITTSANAITAKPKPAGTDDGFKGEGAACGSSVVKVAHKMISSTRTASQRSFGAAAGAGAGAGAGAEEEAASGAGYKGAARRGSRSLPASPAHSPPGSPASRRRDGNRFFTSPFEPAEETGGRGWLTTALLGYKKELALSSSTLTEEDLETRLQGGSLLASVENLGPSHQASAPKLSPQTEPHTTQEPQLAKPAPAFRPKPSELREMNFWSPTSM